MNIDLELAPKTKRAAGEPSCVPVVYPDVDRDQAVRIAEVARALADPVRVQLIDVLRKHAGKVCVCELVPLFDLSQPTVSHHLKVLRQAGLVGSERQGLWAYYYVIPDALAGLAGWLIYPPHVQGDVVTVRADQTELRDVVRAKYAAAATITTERNADCCSAAGAIITEEQREHFGSPLYDQTDRDQLPDRAVLASLGCGNPIAIAELHEGETVLDLGSGGGIDVLLSARRVGPSGLAYGLDMTDEMLDLARRNQAEAGISNVQWLRGHIEEIPLPANTVDVIISNCVINLSADKPQVLREAARVLKPGGRFAVSDVVAEPHMDQATRSDMQAYTGCIAGALTRHEFADALTAAGLTDVTITETHRVHHAAAAAIVRATKPDPGCCSTTAQASCCEPSAKGGCCDTAATSTGGCGCQ